MRRQSNGGLRNIDRGDSRRHPQANGPTSGRGPTRATVTRAVVTLVLAVWCLLTVAPDAADTVSGKPPRHWWELVTPAFVHRVPGIPAVVHLAVMAPVLVAVGTRVEPMLGHRRFLVLTVAAAVAFGITQAVLDRSMTDRVGLGLRRLGARVGLRRSRPTGVVAVSRRRRRPADGLRPLVILLCGVDGAHDVDLRPRGRGRP